eukprot:CAMPEP_0198367250 /NCGR_PEP_ID=MMETSP1450-20131203/155092_1 /TAXON_ID=753684 ORGANISM="Madagascaria erythrocladiodes, Strain CCMP3234" /NCGR_SAMPLE_ID=MMETSP1450 /ASSEMBLY_ACC=CAM_ASM_001115 /LENGTH=571 /DNA_ID=CAMNT_0044074729 /DNA_START=19 /DNA_END=1735 /DNA_ORIENTATION=-
MKRTTPTSALALLLAIAAATASAEYCRCRQTVGPFTRCFTPTEVEGQCRWEVANRCRRTYACLDDSAPKDDSDLCCEKEATTQYIYTGTYDFESHTFGCTAASEKLPEKIDDKSRCAGETTPSPTPTPTPIPATGPPITECTFAVAVALGGDNGELLWELTAEPSGDKFEVRSAPEGDPDAQEKLTGSITIPSGQSYRFRIRDEKSASVFPRSLVVGGEYQVALQGEYLGDGVIIAEEHITFTLPADSCAVQTPPPSTTYKIDYIFDSSVSSELKEVFEAAADRWDRIIQRGNQNKEFVLFGELRKVDDLLIHASVKEVDQQGGTLAYAATSGFRGQQQRYLPYFAEAVVDMADLEYLMAQSLDYKEIVKEILVHELGHALGLSSVLWQINGLISDGVRYSGASALSAYRGYIEEAGSFMEINGLISDGVRYSGASALSAYRGYIEEAGGDPSRAAFVPLENDGGGGTASSHFEEDVFDNELMTGFINAGDNPLSRVSIGSLEDIGYEVDYRQADEYSLPSSTRLRMKDLAQSDDVIVLGNVLIDKKKFSTTAAARPHEASKILKYLSNNN